MSYFELKYSSKALSRNVTVSVILPNPEKGEELRVPEHYKTLYLLHGLAGDHTSWVRNTSIERYAADYGIAVVMPSVERSWYTNTAYGQRYLDFVADELPAVCRGYFRGMSDAREDNYVGGLSMGGYGALKLSLLYPERYAGCIALSASPDITRKNRTYLLEEWRANFGFDIPDALALEGSEHDLFALLDRVSDIKTLPRIFQWCGTEDGLINANREFRDRLIARGAVLDYSESEGNHSWRWWDMHIQRGLKYLFDN